MSAEIRQLQISVSPELYGALQDTAHSLNVTTEELSEWAIIKQILTERRLAAPSKLCTGRKMKVHDIIERRENVLDEKLSAGWQRFLQRVNEQSGHEQDEKMANDKGKKIPIDSETRRKLEVRAKEKGFASADDYVNALVLEEIRKAEVQEKED